MLKALHALLVALLHIERRFDPLFQPVIGLVRAPASRVLQTLIRRSALPEPGTPATETIRSGEEEAIAGIIADMGAYMRSIYKPGGYQRGGNTKTHGIVRGRFIVNDNLPLALRHGLFAAPGDYPCWVRFAGPGPASPPDIEDVGVLSIGVKVMGVQGEKLLADEKFTQDFTGISTPIFTTPNLYANRKLQGWVKTGLPLYYFLDPRDSHIAELLMQGLWSGTKTSPLESDYWSCVPYLLGEGQAIRYGFSPIDPSHTKVPRLPFRPSDNYLREAMAATLASRPVSFDMTLQLQTDPARMPLENASMLWPEDLSPPMKVARIDIPAQHFDNPAQLAFANVLSINPWHCLAAHRPLGNQNRGRKAIYETLSALRQTMNGTPHYEPTGNETFD